MAQSASPLRSAPPGGTGFHCGTLRDSLAGTGTVSAAPSQPVHQLSSQDEAVLPLAAHLISEADTIVVCTGAGMSVSSGLGTFRGKAAGAWAPLVGSNLNFEDMSCPSWFELPSESASGDLKSISRFGYGFWQFRYQQYTQNRPHDGYQIILDWMKGKAFACFSFTSNIDGAWRKIGWPETQLQEVHGSLDFMQCVRNCTEAAKTNIWPSKDEEWKMAIDEASQAIASRESLPACPNCSGLARPNVLMFSDATFDSSREAAQEAAFDKWLERAIATRLKVAVVEIGAGVAIPTVRRMSEYIVSKIGLERASLLRINPEHPEIPASVVGPMVRNISNRFLSMTSDSLTILQRLDAVMKTNDA
jgi:NAD-dependent SIR2 family protein deacetylase